MSSGFALVPDGVLYAPISDRAFRLWTVLRKYSTLPDGARPSRRTLAERLRCSVPSVDRAIDELRAAKLLGVTHRWETSEGVVEAEVRPRGAASLPSRYELIDPTSVIIPDRTVRSPVAAPVRSPVAAPVGSRMITDLRSEISEKDQREGLREKEMLSALNARDVHTPAAFAAGSDGADREIAEDAEAIARQFEGRLSTPWIARYLASGHNREDFAHAYVEWGNRRPNAAPIRNLAAWIIPKIGDHYAERNNGAAPPGPPAESSSSATVTGADTGNGIGDPPLPADDYTLPTCEGCYSAPADGDDRCCAECVAADRIPLALAVAEAIADAQRYVRPAVRS